MILSIGLIVKNEEKYLRKCLEGIKPVLEAIDSELIITDTGSTDSTVDIAREFTDKIYHFDWCDDFSKARNANMDKASGKWYMYLDADEILINPEKVIDFFKSGKCLKYTGMSIIQRSFYDESCETYSDYSPLRIFKNTPNNRFKNAVHETLEVVDVQNMYMSGAVFNHYGYINDKGGRYKKKKIKYTKMTEKLVMEDPINLRNRLQLSTSYSSINDYKSVERTVYEALDICRNIGIKNCIDYYIVFCHDLILAKYREGDYRDIFETEKEYFSNVKDERISNLNIYMLFMNTYRAVADFDKALYYFDKYEALYKRVKNGFYTSDALCIITLLKEPADYIQCSCSAAEVCFKGGMYEKGKRILESIIKMKYIGKSVFNRILNTLVLAVNKNAGEVFFANIYKSIRADKNKLSMFNKYLLSYNTPVFANTAAYKVIYKVLCEKCGKDDIYYDVYYIRNAVFSEIACSDIRDRLQQLKEKNILTPDLLYIICRENISMDYLAENSGHLKDMLIYALNNFANAEKIIYKYIKNSKDNGIMNIELIFHFIAETGIYDNETDNKIIDIYKSKTKAYIDVYNDDMDFSFCIPSVRAGVYALNGDFDKMTECMHSSGLYKGSVVQREECV